MTVPAPFASATAAREGAAGRRWITQLPTLVDRLLEDWDIGLDGPVRHGYVALVIPVRRRDRSSAVLKVSWVDEGTRQEGAALTWWAGHGAVALLDADPTRGALLLEGLDPDRSLEQIPEEDALTVAGSILRRLHSAAAPPTGFSSTADLAHRWSTDLPQRWRQLGRPGHRDVVAAAIDTCRDLAADPGRPHLLHGDFHYANVLTGPRGWMAIDPKPKRAKPKPPRPSSARPAAATGEVTVSVQATGHGDPVTSTRRPCCLESPARHRPARPESAPKPSTLASVPVFRDGRFRDARLL